MTDIVGVTTPSLVGLNGKPIVAKDKEPEVPVEDRAKQLPRSESTRLNSSHRL
jgi:hypothetical protein